MQVWRTIMRAMAPVIVLSTSVVANGQNLTNSYSRDARFATDPAFIKARIRARSRGLNDPVGTYPNDPKGYLYRSLIVVEGGVANIGLDAVYP